LPNWDAPGEYSIGTNVLTGGKIENMGANLLGNSLETMTFNFSTFNLVNGVKITAQGSRPLTLLATENIFIGGTIDVSGSNGSNGIAGSGGGGAIALFTNSEEIFIDNTGKILANGGISGEADINNSLQGLGGKSNASGGQGGNSGTIIAGGPGGAGGGGSLAGGGGGGAKGGQKGQGGKSASFFGGGNDGSQGQNKQGGVGGSGSGGGAGGSGGGGAFVIAGGQSGQNGDPRGTGMGAAPGGSGGGGAVTLGVANSKVTNFGEISTLGGSSNSNSGGKGGLLVLADTFDNSGLVRGAVLLNNIGFENPDNFFFVGGGGGGAGGGTGEIIVERVPEPTLTLSLLALGTLGTASALKRKQN
jgi:hypothetical protein